MKPSKRSRVISSFIVMDILERAKELEAQGRNIIHFEVGEPDFKTPKAISDAGIKAIKEGKTKYTHSMGMPELREEISRHYRNEYRVSVEPDRIIVTNGSSAALLLTLGSIINPGDNILLPNPHYACYPNYVTFLGGKVIDVPLSEADGFQLSAEELSKKITRKSRGILINSPSNPTGTVLKPGVMKEIAALGTTIISDEIYHGLTYGVKAHSILEYTDNAFVIGGFSKRYAMTGWRVGYVIGPRECMRPMQKEQQNFQISANSIAQEAALAALRSAKADADKMRSLFDERRKVMVKGLREIGFSIKSEPKGAFYIFAPCGFLDSDSMRLARRILEEAGVGVTPGIDFGSGGEGYLRLSYAASIPRIKTGLKRLKTFVEKNG